MLGGLKLPCTAPIRARRSKERAEEARAKTEAEKEAFAAQTQERDTRHAEGTTRYVPTDEMNNTPSAPVRQTELSRHDQPLWAGPGGRGGQANSKCLVHSCVVLAL